VVPYCGFIIPQGSSINNDIDPDEFSMHYINLNQIICMVLKHGPGALMAKFDVEAAYRNIAVHPDGDEVAWPVL